MTSPITTAAVTTRRILHQSGPVLTGTQGIILTLVQRHLEYQVRADKDFQAHDAQHEAAARGAQDELEFAISLLTRLDQATVAMLLLEGSD